MMTPTATTPGAGALLEWFIYRADALLELMSPSLEEIISEADVQYVCA